VTDDPIRVIPRDWYGGTDLKRMVGMNRVYADPTRHTGERWERGPNLLIGINAGRIRLRYPDGTDFRINYLHNPSETLQHLVALWVCHLLPGGVLADCLEESFPDHTQAANFLREWEQVKQQEIMP
jgi:hypothetical protein